MQVGRNALPLFNAGLVGTQRQTLYLHTEPDEGRDAFGADILYPVLVRDAEALGIYKALGVPAADGDHAQRTAARHHQRHQPRAGRFRSPTASPATSSRSMPPSIRSFPNGRRLGGGTAPNRHQVNVNTVLISLIAAGDPARGSRQGRRNQR